MSSVERIPRSFREKIKKIQKKVFEEEGRMVSFPEAVRIYEKEMDKLRKSLSKKTRFPDFV
jgi:glutathionyl-hydroquinone reductase